LNKQNGIFNWYPYNEGFSKPFVDKIISNFNIVSNNIVLDPFSGSGTTALSCYLDGINSLSIEVNPFMNFVGETKVNSLKINPDVIRDYFLKIKLKLESLPLNVIEIPTFLKNKSFFLDYNLEEALKIKFVIANTEMPKDIRNFFLLHLSAIIVRISNMVRAADLRYKRQKPGKLNVIEIFYDKIYKALDDYSKIINLKHPDAYFLNEDICNYDVKKSPFYNKIDYFITSPPYLNGTNYDRNTKLEMGFLDFIKTDMDLQELRMKSVIAGINSTKTRNVYKNPIQFIKPLVEQIKINAYDERIPKMVNGYFNDMNLAIENISKLLTKNGKGVIVVGDSQYAGVYIETDLILSEICEMNNLEVAKIDVVRKRISKNGMELRESIIYIRK
jgi:DNA modification methylase